MHDIEQIERELQETVEAMSPDAREAWEAFFEADVEERVRNFEALEGIKLHPHVFDDGSKFLITASAADFPGGHKQFLSRNRGWAALVEEIREDTETGYGRAVLAKANKRFKERE